MEITDVLEIINKDIGCWILDKKRVNPISNI